MSELFRGAKGIVLFGGMGTGKSTIGDLFMEILEQKGISCSSYNIGDSCRQFMKIAKVEPRWKDRDRALAQQVADKFREIDKNFLNQYVMATLMEDGSDFSIVIGGRTCDDYNYWISKGFIDIGILTSEDVIAERIIKRDGIYTPSDRSHETEANVGCIARDVCRIRIDNNSDLQKLRNSVSIIMDAIVKML